jgi:prepilin-type N-terminal cleavage/methylation domain-containing protein
MMWAKKQTGFTIVELLIVVVVIAILAAITIVAYNGIQTQAQAAKQKSDIATFHKAILMARNNTGKVLKNITNSTYSIGNCISATANPSATEPRDLPKSHACWVSYYNTLDTIGAAANINLDGLRAGDTRGNPYGIDENEGESCNDDQMYTFNGSGVSRTTVLSITRTAPC